MKWPDDADGDVLRRLEADNFDFDKVYSVDFNVEFETWPPPEEAIDLLKKKYSEIEIFEPENDGIEEYAGYIAFKIKSRITYEFVTQTQEDITVMVEAYGGWCESWGVMGD